MLFNCQKKEDTEMFKVYLQAFLETCIKSNCSIMNRIKGYDADQLSDSSRAEYNAFNRVINEISNACW